MEKWEEKNTELNLPDYQTIVENLKQTLGVKEFNAQNNILPYSFIYHWSCHENIGVPKYIIAIIYERKISLMNFIEYHKEYFQEEDSQFDDKESIELVE